MIEENPILSLELLMKKLLLIVLLGAVGSLISACSAPQPNEIVESPQITPTSIHTPQTIQIIPPTITPTTVQMLTTPTVQKAVISTPTLTAIPPTEPLPTESTKDFLIVNHESLDLFNQIPDEYITRASMIKLMVRGASVEDNIRLGLECLWGNYPDRRPSQCFDFHDLKYDPSNWDLQFRANPGWIDKVTDYITASEQQMNDYDAFTFVFGYVDGFDGTTYPEISDPDNFSKFYIDKIEELETAHPDKIFIMWTMSLARLGFENTQKFNNMVRTYASENGKILLDIADIESHDPDGTIAMNESGYEVIYQGYTNEKRSGHLNAVGSERMAKALWILMSKIAGWDGPPG
jgi:hypothetical protein